MHYNKARGYFIGDLPRDPERERARLRIKTYRRKDWSRLTDITPEYETTLRAITKRCPLCAAKLVDKPYLPASKELDHIVPRGVGGTHTIGNVRIICRSCNLARPDDGSDYTCPVTLWAEVA
jgi:5-methylcytosine-specific restriction endonuclease McrA